MDIKYLKVFLVLLVFFHFIVIILNTASFFVCVFYLPWYLYVPVCTMIGRLIFGSGVCPLTSLENAIRKRLGKKEIDAFVKYYISDRIIKWLMETTTNH